MYERFTDRSRQVMQLANREAQRFNHEYVGTEHILLGLLKEGRGVAAVALSNLQLDPRTLRLRIEALVLPGPEMVTMGKLPLTPRAKKVVEHAINVAREHNDNYVGTEHILIGLLREKEGVAYQVLTELGLAEQALQEVLHLLGKEDALDEVEKAVADQDFELAAQLQQITYDAALWRVYCAFTLHTVKGENSRNVLMEISKIIKQVGIK
jgi:ATP-dependent Clp protease ATP-binding subunit ClpA